MKQKPNKSQTPDTLVQTFGTSIVQNFIKKMHSIKSLKHPGAKGQFRESFVAEILGNYLSSQFGTGTGIVVNQRGDQSRQVDIIIYDNRLLPAFIRDYKLGVFPAESVIATIEIKSDFTNDALEKTESDAKYLYENIYCKEGSKYKDFTRYRPICAILGYYGSGRPQLKDEIKGKKWLRENIEYLKYIGVVDKYSWIKIKKTGWTCHMVDNSNDETTRFISVLLDNIRWQAELRLRALSNSHRDWLGIYLRHQNLFDKE
jgi:hypothetical protein